MVYQPTNPNYGAGIRHQEIRSAICPIFVGTNAQGKPGLIEQLSAIYYDHWKLGDYSVAFFGHAPATGATRLEAQALFNDIHGLLHDRMSLMLLNANAVLPPNRRDPDMDKIYDDNGNVLAETRSERFAAKIAAGKTRGIDVEAMNG